MAEPVRGTGAVWEPNRRRYCRGWESQTRCNRRENWRRRRNDAGCWSSADRLGAHFGRGPAARAAQPDVGLGSLEAIAKFLQNRGDDAVFAVGIATRPHTQGHYRIDSLLHFPDQPDDLLGAVDRRFDLDRKSVV